MASVHGCTRGRSCADVRQCEQKPVLARVASGVKLSASLTEPAREADGRLHAGRTPRRRFIVNGEKLFITNVVPGRTLGLVCLIEGKPAVLVVDLPAEENENFQLVKYGLYALKHTYNRGIIFKDFRVPAANSITQAKTD
jgi:alkylation response protein AidB-like acyl-CoA dehydrogenase